MAPDRAQEVLHFIETLGRVSSVADFVDLGLAGLAKLVPADLWGFNDIDPHTRDLVAFIHPEREYPPEMHEAVQRVVWQHPVLERMTRTGIGSPRRLSDFWTQEEYHCTELYQHAYKHIGVEYQVSFLLVDGRTAAPLGFAANRSDRDFTDEELDVLQQLRPSLLNAWQRASASNILMEMVAASGSDRPQILVDASTRVVTFHPAAAELLASVRVDLRPGDVLPEPVIGWLRRTARRSDERLVLGDQQVSVALLAGAPEAERVLAVEATSDRSPLLSKREADVLDAVAEGCSDAEIASLLGISRRTVQKHLQRIYAKLGVSSRTAAVRATRG